MIAALRERDWAGDDVLGTRYEASQFAGRIGFDGHAYDAAALDHAFTQFLEVGAAASAGIEVMLELQALTRQKLAIQIGRKLVFETRMARPQQAKWH